MDTNESDTTIAERQSLTALIEARNKIMVLWQERHEIEEEIENLMNVATGDSYVVDSITRSRQDVRLYVDRKFWWFLAESSQLTNAMTSKSKNELYSKLEQEPPEFNENEVRQYAKNLQHLYGDNALQTVKEVYTGLIAARYYTGNQEKKNNLRAVEKIFKIRGNIFWDSFFKQFRHRENLYGFDYADLLTACYLLDTGIRPTYAEEFRVLAREMEKNGSSFIETPYFVIEAHKNGNQTVRWRKEKLTVLKNLNKYGPAESNALPDSMKKRCKPEHFKNE